MYAKSGVLDPIGSERSGILVMNFKLSAMLEARNGLFVRIKSEIVLNLHKRSLKRGTSEFHA